MWVPTHSGALAEGLEAEETYRFSESHPAVRLSSLDQALKAREETSIIQKGSIIYEFI